MSRTSSLLVLLSLAACSSTHASGDGGEAMDAVDAPAADTGVQIDAVIDADATMPADATDVPLSIDASDVPVSTDASDDAVPTDAVPTDAVPTDAVVGDASGTIHDVQHVVIFVQENRSFDHYFGTLSGVRGFADPSAPRLQTGNSDFDQPNGASDVLPYHTGFQCINDLLHDWLTGHIAWNGGHWDQWILAKGPEAMSSYARADLALYYALADAYTVFDAYHAPVIGPTNPNRLYLMTGMIDPTGTGGGPITDNSEPSAGFTWTTYPERLQAAGVSWKVYQAADNYDDNALAWFRPFINAHPGDALYDRGMAHATDVVQAFHDDVVAGTLPQVSWIIAPTMQSEHPPYALVSGEVLTQGLLQALAANPTVANSTIFLLTYDENGGFFDHVTPPTPPSGTAAEFVGGVPIGLGSRVPMIAISPWSRGGVVDSEVSDHTSILRLLEQFTGVRETNISDWRRQVAGDLTSGFDFAHPDFTTPMLPTVTDMTCIGRVPVVPTTQAIPVQESGTRPARALPYQPNATSRTDCAAGLFYIDMTNTGTATVHDSIAANQFRTDGPWQYDIAPGGMVEDYFSVVTFGGGQYDLTAYGPNGFERQYAGNINVACGMLEVTSTLHPMAGTIDLTFVNQGSTSVTFSTTATHYRTDGPWMTTVAAGGSQVQTWDVASMGQGWYALAVGVSSDGTFLRRFVGHLENGSQSVTGE